MCLNPLIKTKNGKTEAVELQIIAEDENMRSI